MKKQKLIATVMLATTIGSLGFIPTVANPMISQAATNVSQGKIIVHYVDQTGKSIRPATTATGATGTRYVADVPAISGYSYFRIENGQNDNNGPEMVFGGDDGVTDVSEMTIVYTATGNSSKQTPAPGKATGENGRSQTSSQHENEQAVQGTQPHANNSATSEKKQRASTKQGANQQQAPSNNQQQTDQQTKATKKKKATKQQPAKQASKRNQHGIFLWGVAGLIGLAIVGGVAWKWLRKPRQTKH
ncbi:MucBP domain-containing protein [Fructilactobacillus ixorae]|uniref:MucBP domain-containing protein n=1 Tax=Fructilactobacillus ixorae TaxID=1750535 RepID=A0ABY5C7F1_9LACO|nr:MucBP domain-containing protein [Fructilactobacillus ixorae]USS93280.1 MucBP domain-containing protein [Fructilactobacillus ixorae]